MAQENKETKLAQWLRDRCKEERLSLRGAASKTGLSHATIADIFRGVSPAPGTIRKLAQGFGADGGNGQALEDSLLILAGYRSQPPGEADLSPPLARLMDTAAGFDESQLKVMLRFAEFLAELETEKERN